MTTIGIISDTHSHFDDKLDNFFKDIDLMIHAGDIGSLELADKLSAKYKLEAVSGNIDNHTTRSVYPLERVFMVEKVKILLTHIGGYPNRYYPEFKQVIERHKPQIVVCGHSHILKVIYDKKLEHLHINPGAAGIMGFHKIRTALRLKIDGERIFDLEVGEWDRA